MSSAGFLFLAAVSGMTALGCDEPEPLPKKPVICDEGSTAKGCPPATDPKRPPPSTASTTLPTTPMKAEVVDRPAPTEDPKDKDKEKDAGPADPPATTPAPPTLGPACTKLKECCGNLRTAKITGSAAQCDRVVEDKNEFSCNLANEDYKKPDETYDPVCF